MLQFDENGHLFPYEVQDITLDEMREVFVGAFPESETRKRLFDNYLDWVFDFQRDVFPYFTQWIDGSFVTQKLNPKDIDFVTFLDWQVYEIKEKWKELDRFWSFSNEDKGLDAYFLAEFPEKHKNYGEFHSLREGWLLRYGYTRRDEQQRAHPKGFIQINFSKT
jgi:hypothetical protein